MQVKFEATLEDFVDVNLRSMKHSKVFHSEQKSSRLVMSILAGLVVYVIVPSSFEVKLIFGVMSLVLVTATYPFILRKSIEKNVRDLCREQMGTDKSFWVEVEVSTEGLTFKQLGSRVTLDWSTVREIQVADDRIEFLLQNGSVSTVRTRAFETSEQQKEFIELADRYWHKL